MLMFDHKFTMLMFMHKLSASATSTMRRIGSPEDFGALVRRTRREAGLTQQALAERIGVSRFWLAAFERGKEGVELGLVLRTLKALGITVRAGIELTDPVDAAVRAPARDTRIPHVDLGALLDRYQQRG